ncbi:MAG: hypothetical protein HC901_00985 [Bdellovibrionaceae bacterium]|nr:hypothetical protein [Pseudobdellovibrionaceae bacterium]
MKSAYERAMERMGGGASASPALTDAQKQAIAEINNRFHAKIAERETFLNSQIQQALSAGNPPEADQLQQQLVRDLAALRDDWEREKRKIRNPS